MKIGFLQSKDMLILAIVTLLTVCIWIFLSIYSTATKKVTSPQTQQLTTPISPQIRTDVLNKLEAAPQ